MMLRISRGVLAAPLLALTAIIAPARAAPLPVGASFSVLGDLVRQIGGERVTVVTLVGPDGDTHVFEPSPDDARALAAARLVVVNGLGLEGWISRLIHSSGYRGPVVVASDGVTPRTGDTHAPGVDPHAPGVDTHAHGVDPHAWQNVANAGLYVRNLGEALASADPEHGAEYRANADAYRARLEGLDREVRDAFARLRLVDRAHAPVGVTVSVAPGWNTIDTRSGIPATVVSVESMLSIDAALVPDTLFGAINLIHGLEHGKERDATAWSDGSTLGAGAALSYRVLPTVFVGGEVRYLRAYEGTLGGRYAGDGIFAGPSVHVQIAHNAWASLSWSMQVHGHEAAGASHLNLTDFERHQVRLKVGFEF